MIKRMIAAFILSAITACATVTGSFIPKGNLNNYYADCGVIMQDITKTQDDLYEITITMQNGNQFSFLSEDGDWEVGEIVSAIFADNGTPNVSDDVIISCRYSGWVSDDELQNWIK